MTICAHCPGLLVLAQLDETDNIKVAVRVRPLLPFEREKGASSVLNVTKDHTTVEVCGLSRESASVIQECTLSAMAPLVLVRLFCQQC